MKNIKVKAYIESKLNIDLSIDAINKISDNFCNSWNSTLIVTKDFMSHNINYKITNDDLYTASTNLFSELINNLDLTVILFLYKDENSKYFSIPTKDLENAAVSIRREIIDLEEI